jgi:hypothetical protein
MTPGTTPALKLLVSVGVIVVGEFLATFDVLAGDDSDRLVDDIAVAIGPARVLDGPRDVTVDVRVDHPMTIHAEAPDLAATQILVLPIGTLLGENILPVIGNDALVLIDILLSEHPHPWRLERLRLICKR